MRLLKKNRLPQYKLKHSQSISSIISQFVYNECLWFGAHNPVIMIVVLGIQWMLTAMLVSSFLPQMIEPAYLLDLGRNWYEREFEMQIFIIGCAAIIVTGVLAQFLQNKFRKDAARSNFLTSLIFLSSLAVFLVIMVVSQKLVFLHWQEIINGPNKFIFALIWTTVLLLPGGISILIFLAVKNRIKFNQSLKNLREFLNDKHLLLSPKGAGKILPESVKSPLWDKIIDISVIFGIVLFIYIPEYRNFSGLVFSEDQFIHWDGFATRAALTYARSGILGQDVYIQYGLGWPLTYSLLAFWNKLSYGYIIYVSVIYACIYYIGVYLLLRRLTRSIFWANFSLLPILFFTVFNPVFHKDLLYPFWWYPSSTALRAPMDIWFFMVLFIILTQKQRFWQWILGAITGLALIFGFDTGMYLIGVWLLAQGLLWLSARQNREKTAQKQQIFTSFFSAIVLSLVFLFGVMIASRGRWVAISYWVKLFSGLSAYSQGISHLPLARLDYSPGLILFTLMLLVYLVAATWSLGQVLVHKASYKKIFLLCLSLYGLARLLIFVSRSDQSNTLHPSLPFWLVAGIAGAWFCQKYHVQRKNFAFTPYLFIRLFLVIFLILGSIRKFPILLNSLSGSGSSSKSCLLTEVEDVCEIPEYRRQTQNDYLALLQSIKELKVNPSEIAVYDDWDGLIAVSLSSKPYFAYRPVETLLVSQLEQVKQKFLRTKPQIFVLRKTPNAFVDSWRQMHEIAVSNYNLKTSVAGFDIWQIN